MSVDKPLPDVVIIGAGPVGCVTALAHAHCGANVLMLDGNPKAANRLAGEWLHPPGVKILERLGLSSIPKQAHVGRGFVIFPNDGSNPITLNYPSGSLGMTCEHSTFVSQLREAAQDHANIRFLSPARATSISGQTLTYAVNGHAEHSVSAETIVGADGRSSLARKCLGFPDDRLLASSMAGVLLEGVELYRKGFGQVILGGPGPVLGCRIGDDQIRLFLDFPAWLKKTDKNAAFLWQHYSPVLPKEWLNAFRKALTTGEVAWASNHWRARARYGRPGLALVGDAVGHFHPLTAVGMTLGFLDGHCLANSESFADYRRERLQATNVAELLAVALYNVFTRQDPGTTAIRNGLFELWRRVPMECSRTMRLLSGEVTDLGQFSRSFLHVMAMAVPPLVGHTWRPERWRQLFHAVCGFGDWLWWWMLGSMWGQRQTSSGPSELFSFRAWQDSSQATRQELLRDAG